MSAPPPLTVGVPVYNGEEYLESALGTIQAQTFTDIEVIISDNASTDGTEEIARAYAASDPRFVYTRTDTNIGGARNFNRLLDLARSPLFRWAHYDDVSAPEFLATSVATLADHPDAVAAWPRLVFIDEADRRVSENSDADLDLSGDVPHERLELLLRRVVGQVNLGVLRTDVARRAGGMATHVAGEMVLPVSLAVRGPLVAVPGQLLSIRVHPGRFGGNRRSEKLWADPTRTRMAFPYSRSSWLLLGAVRRAGLAPAERRRCEAVLLRRWTLPRWRTVVGDLLRLPEDIRG